MPTRDQVLSLLHQGMSYEEAGARLRIPPGQAYMVATGLPADGGDVPTPEEADRDGIVAGSTQHLSNPGAENPTTSEHVLEWVRGRASADPQMRQAASRRDAAPGPPREEDATSEVTTVLGRDHNQVKALMEQLETIPGRSNGGSEAQMSRRKSIVDMMTAELNKHERAEEKHLWPAVREALGDGDSWAEKALSQEQEAQGTLAALGKVGGDDEDFDDLVEKLTLQLRRHVAFEDRLFMELRAAMPEGDREQLGSAILSTKR